MSTTMQGPGAGQDAGARGPDSTLWHYILTLGTAGGALSSIDGTVWLAPGATRSRVLADLRAEVREQGGRGGAVLFFSLEPQALERRAVELLRSEEE